MSKFSKTILIVGVLVAAGLVALILGSMGGGEGKRGCNGSTATTNTPPPPPPPPPPVETVRIQQTYLPKHTYLRTTGYEIQGTGEHKDWGLGLKQSFLYAGTVETRQLIEQNDGRTIVSKIAIPEASSIEARKQFDGARFDLGKRIHLIADLAGTESGLWPPGSTRLAEKALNTILETKAGQNLVTLFGSEFIKVVNIEAIAGYEFRVTFQDGKFVKDGFAMLNAPGFRDYGVQPPWIDDKDVEEFFAKFNPNPDVYLFPDEGVAVGATWPIAGRHLPITLPPDLNASLDGEITVRREPDRDGKVVIGIPGEGQLLLLARPRGQMLRSKLVLRGEMVYCPELRVVIAGKFTGEIPIGGRSQGHVLFEMAHDSVTTFKVDYTCDVQKP